MRFFTQPFLSGSESDVQMKPLPGPSRSSSDDAACSQYIFTPWEHVSPPHLPPERSSLQDLIEVSAADWMKFASDISKSSKRQPKVKKPSRRSLLHTPPPRSPPELSGLQKFLEEKKPVRLPRLRTPPPRSPPESCGLQKFLEKKKRRLPRLRTPPPRSPPESSGLQAFLDYEPTKFSHLKRKSYSATKTKTCPPRKRQRIQQQSVDVSQANEIARLIEQWDASKPIDETETSATFRHTITVEVHNPCEPSPKKKKPCLRKKPSIRKPKQRPTKQLQSLDVIEVYNDSESAPFIEQTDASEIGLQQQFIHDETFEQYAIHKPSQQKKKSRPRKKPSSRKPRPPSIKQRASKPKVEHTIAEDVPSTFR